MLPFNFISKYHCTLLLNAPDSSHEDFYYTIVDGVPLLSGKSTNGVFVNGRQVIREESLKSGDIITFDDIAQFPTVQFMQEQEINPEDTMGYEYEK